MRLHQFIIDNMEVILQAWENFARRHQPEEGEMTVAELRDHAEQMLRAMVAKMQLLRSGEGEAKPGSDGHPNPERDSAAQRHASERLFSGFPVDVLVAEYRALRTSVLRLWLGKLSSLQPEQLEDMMRFNEAVDEALSESVKRYAEVVAMEQDISIGILGHDLRTPLQSVSLGAQRLVHDRALDEDIRQLGAGMHKSIRRMAVMVDNLLDFTKSRVGGAMQIRRAHCDLKPIAAQVIDELHSYNPGRSIRCTFDGNCSGYWDPDRIAQVYQNLVGNALQYGDKARPVSVHTEGGSGWTRIRVQSFGPSIPTQEQKRIFSLLRRYNHSFEKGDSRRNLGLGLYIVSEVVSAHGGSVEVSSTDAEGTEFVVKLPRSEHASGHRGDQNADVEVDAEEDQAASVE